MIFYHVCPIHNIVFLIKWYSEWLYSVFTCCEHETSPRHVVLKISSNMRTTDNSAYAEVVYCVSMPNCAANYACTVFHYTVYFYA